MCNTICKYFPVPIKNIKSNLQIVNVPCSGARACRAATGHHTTPSRYRYVTPDGVGSLARRGARE